MVLEKMENAFAPGDPVLTLAATAKRGTATTLEDVGKQRDSEHWVLREEQTLIDAIVSGQTKGQYHLLVGEKGTGMNVLPLINKALALFQWKQDFSGAEDLCQKALISE